MLRVAKLSVLYACKLVGLFVVARWMTRRGVRILCYHGLASINEYAGKPKLFMRPETFRHRMEFLRARGFPVVPLAEAVDHLGNGKLPDCATVITFDDGWHSVYRDALPILQEMKIPATVYIATYYVDKGIPDPHALLEYALNNAVETRLYLADFPESVRGPWNLTDERARARALAGLIAFIDSRPAEARPGLVRSVVDCVGLEWEQFEKYKMFYLLDSGEIRALGAAGIDIQLHTRRHRLPFDDKSAVEREIAENRRDLGPLVSAPLHHLAYPKGEYDPCQFGWLDGVGIKSATTCQPGLNYAGTPRLELSRFLDGENVSDIEFEAELSGMATILRNLARFVPTGARRGSAAPKSEDTLAPSR